MKLFVKKIVKYTLVLYGFFLLLLFTTSLIVKHKAANRGRGIVIDKIELLKRTASPKIIIIGGSNVCYGLNASIIQDSLHLPVADMSINAGVGMVFYMNQIKPYINKGDMVISIPEYGAYNDDEMFGNESVYGLCTVDPSNIKTLTPYQWLRLIKFGGDVLKDNYTAFIANSNSNISNGRKLYNQYGDYEGHKNKPSIINKTALQNIGKKYITNSNSFFKEIYQLNEYCTTKKAFYYQSFPVFAREYYKDTWGNEIMKSLPEINFINSPEDYLFGVDSLYDSENHLLFQYRDIRSNRLVNDIKKKGLNK